MKIKKEIIKKLIKEVIYEVLKGMEAFTDDQIDALKEMGFMKMKFPVPQIVDGQQPAEQLHLDSLELFGFKWDENHHVYNRHYVTDNDIDVVESVYFSPSRPMPVVFVRTVKNANNGEGLQSRFSEFKDYEKLEIILERLSRYESDVIASGEPVPPSTNPPVATQPEVPPVP